MEKNETITLPPVAEALLGWYAHAARKLPWRENVTPYRVWVSEIMLQQTRIEAAKEYFRRFMQALPDVRSLANAERDTVLKLWEGLGYYSRARHLHEAARVILDEYGGELPADVKKLRALPGIGDYTAGAIASIAFGLPEPAVDGNVMRICARLTACPRSIAEPKLKIEFREQLREQYTRDCGALSSAIMELGETVCVPGTPDCGRCPLANVCAAHALGRETDFPVMPAKKARRIEPRTVLLLRCGGRTALCRRPESGLLAGLWEFVNLAGRMEADAVRAWCDERGLVPREIRPCGSAVHIFSHLEWHMEGFCVDCGCAADGFVWAEDVSAYALPTAMRTYKNVWERQK